MARGAVPTPLYQLTRLHKDVTLLAADKLGFVELNATNAMEDMRAESADSETGSLDRMIVAQFCWDCCSRN